MSVTPYRLSLFDKSPVPEGATGAEALAFSVAFAQEAEALGFHRIWLAEHHGAKSLAGSAPEVLAAFILANTSRIRVGSGGVLLQHYSPYKVAEQFRVLAALAPGRVDAGIGKAPGGLPLNTRALQTAQSQTPVDFAQKLADLTSFLKTGLAEDHPLYGAQAFPQLDSLPEFFLLGGSVDSAKLAANLGWNLTFAGHFDGGDELIRTTFSAYHAIAGETPSLSLSVIVSETQANAEALAAKQTIYKVSFMDGRSFNLPSEEAAHEFARQSDETKYHLEERHPRVLAGTADFVRAELDRLSEVFGISEFLIDLPEESPSGRLKAIQYLANADHHERHREVLETENIQ